MKKIIVFTTTLLLLLTGYLYYDAHQVIKIGFVGELSTSTSQLSVESRESFLYVIDQVNAKGGVEGRKILPKIYDDQFDNNYKAALNKKLEEDGIELIVGFNISSMAPTAEYLMANGDYLIISPTISTDYMDQKDDDFIKMAPKNKAQSERLFKKMKEKDIKRLLIVYSEANKLYSEGISKRMEELMAADGRETVLISSGSEIPMKRILQEANAFKADGIFLVLNGSDSAEIVQQARIEGYEGLFFGSAWSATTDLIQNSGRYLEGYYTLEFISKNPDTEKLDRLAAYIKERTGAGLNFSHKSAYNATALIIEGIQLAKSSSPEAVKAAILKKGEFKGIDSEYSIDRYGDPMGDYQLLQVINGKFEKVE